MTKQLFTKADPESLTGTMFTEMELSGYNVHIHSGRTGSEGRKTTKPFTTTTAAHNYYIHFRTAVLKDGYLPARSNEAKRAVHQPILSMFQQEEVAA